MFTKIRGKDMYNTSASDSFHGQGRYAIKMHFQHLLTGRTYCVLNLWCIYRSVNEYQNKCFIVQKFYILC